MGVSLPGVVGVDAAPHRRPGQEDRTRDVVAVELGHQALKAARGNLPAVDHELALDDLDLEVRRRHRQGEGKDRDQKQSCAHAVPRAHRYFVAAMPMSSAAPVIFTQPDPFQRQMELSPQPMPQGVPSADTSSLVRQPGFFSQILPSQR